MTLAVPTLDLQALGTDPRPLAEACTEWGFFKLTGHGVDPARRARFMAAARAFFSAPAGVKQAVLRTADNPWGYFDRELTKNRQDWKEIFDFGIDPVGSDQDPSSGQSVSQWPSGIHDFQPAMLDWFDACYQLSLRLLEHLLPTLGAAPDALHGAFAPAHSSFLRLNYYPLCDDPADPAEDEPRDGHLGISHHTDAGALTVLVSDDVPGLQVKRDGRWYTVSPDPDAFIVNVGDLVQVWSNNRYRAPLHRVLANARDVRYSAPFFLNPCFDCNVVPLTDEPAAYRAVNWGAYRSGRAAGDYADVGQEVQISDYATDS